MVEQANSLNKNYLKKQIKKKQIDIYIYICMYVCMYIFYQNSRKLALELWMWQVAGRHRGSAAAMQQSGP